jgi:hypothetical protein
MGLWPFRRRSNRRVSPSAMRREENMHDARSQPDRARDSELDTTSPGPGRRKSRTDSQGRRRASRESKRLEKRRAYSFASGQNDSIAVRRDANAPPVPPLPPHLNGQGTPTPGKSLRSHTKPPDGRQDWQRVPTLHKRSAQDMSRRQSSKKRKEEHTREAEIKAMSTSMPTRPATELGLSGRPMKKESKRMRGGLNNPSSDISLPTAESIRSSFSSDADQPAAYKVSAFYILSPRPTIRYSQNPHYASGASLASDNPESQKRRVSDRVRLSDDILKANKRVDDLADDLSAGELRELMDRDQKRKERKKTADQIKIQKKLAHRQEQQREAEANAERAGSPPPVNMERGVLGRDVVGVDIGTSAVVTSSKRKGSVGSETGRGKRPAEAFKPDTTTNTHSSINPSLTTDTTAPSSAEPVTEADFGASTSPGIPLPLPQAAETGTRRAVSASQKSELSVPEVPTPGAAAIPPVSISPAQSKRRISETSTRPPQSWTSFFKRSPKQKPALIPPPSFSNTSRDSMQTSQGTQVAYTPTKPTPGFPKRTMSKFREDLPELPMSPPYSRVQSPEADIVPPIRKEFVDKRSSTQALPEEPHVRYDTPTSGHRSLDIARVRNETPNSGDRSVDVPSPDPAALLSQSLASIDSEGSWLSGRKNSKRGSTQLSSHPLRDSASSLHKRYRDYTESTEELGIAEDEYFSRLTPGYEDYKTKRQSTGNPMASSDEEDGGSLAGPVEPGKTTWGAVGRRPTVIHHQPRAKSREGLLNEFEYDSGSEAPGEHQVEIDRDSKDSDESDIRVHRATSVDLGIKHARHISAGSARLLELKGRASGDSKRLSLSSDLG